MARPKYSVKQVIQRGYLIKGRHPTYSQPLRGTTMFASHYDCSSFIGTICGISEIIGDCPATPDMKYYYPPNLGYIYYPYSQVAGSLKEGDILVWNQGTGYGNNGHTGLYLKDGRLLEMVGPTGAGGVSDSRYYTYRSNWEYVLRNPNSGLYIEHWSPTDGRGGKF